MPMHPVAVCGINRPDILSRLSFPIEELLLKSSYTHIHAGQDHALVHQSLELESCRANGKLVTPCGLHADRGKSWIRLVFAAFLGARFSTNVFQVGYRLIDVLIYPDIKHVCL